MRPMKMLFSASDTACTFTWPNTVERAICSTAQASPQRSSPKASASSWAASTMLSAMRMVVGS